LTALDASRTQKAAAAAAAAAAEEEEEDASYFVSCISEQAT
jgi:hypothetical protein